MTKYIFVILKIVVAILNFNGKNWLEQFLPCVIANSKEAEIIIIDNASTDDSISFLKGYYPSLKIIKNNHNTGFAGGYNEGLKTIEADYFVLLNSDVEVTPNWITPVIALLESDKSIAAAQPKVLAYNNKEYFEHAGAAGGMMDKYGYPFCRGRIFHKTDRDAGQFNETKEVFWATGACLFIRASVFKEHNGFDASFFAHMEEIDLCWRLKNNGLKVFYCPDSTIFHVGGGTLSYMSPFKTFLNFRNSLFTLHKNYSGWLPLVIFIRLILDGVAGIKFLLGFEFQNIFSILKAHVDYYKNIPKLNRFRRNTTRKNYKKLQGVYNKSIVYQFFILKKERYSEL